MSKNSDDGVVLYEAGVELAQRFIDSRGQREIGTVRKAQLEAASRTLETAFHVLDVVEALRALALLELVRFDETVNYPEHKEIPVDPSQVLKSVSLMIRYIERISFDPENSTILRPYSVIATNPPEASEASLENRGIRGARRGALAILLLLIDLWPELRRLATIESSCAYSGWRQLQVPTIGARTREALLVTLKKWSPLTEAFVRTIAQDAPIALPVPVSESAWFPEICRYDVVMQLSDPNANLAVAIDQSMVNIEKLVQNGVAAGFTLYCDDQQILSSLSERSDEEDREKAMIAAAAAILCREVLGLRSSAVFSESLFREEVCPSVSKAAEVSGVVDVACRLTTIGRTGEPEVFKALCPYRPGSLGSVYHSKF